MLVTKNLASRDSYSWRALSEACDYCSKFNLDCYKKRIERGMVVLTFSPFSLNASDFGHRVPRAFSVLSAGDNSLPVADYRKPSADTRQW